MKVLYRVSESENGKTVRDILRCSMAVSYSAIKSAKWDQRILLNGEPVRVDQRVQTGDRVEIRWKQDQPVYELKPFALELNIVWMDEYLTVIDKPAPLASQSSAGHPDDSLENALYSYFGCPKDYVYRPVNRLDKGTSGLMIVARDPHTQQLLQKQLHTDTLVRSYRAVTEGIPNPAEGVIDFPIGKIPEATVKRRIDPDGKPSLTRYKVLKTGNGRALLQLKLETGRTHQIRVHLSAIGCPVFGDFLYGMESETLPGRFALHSSELEFTHPITGKRLSFLSPLPGVFEKLID